MAQQNKSYNLPFVDKYKDGKYSFKPTDDIPHQKKKGNKSFTDNPNDPDGWVLKKMQYMYNSYLRDNTFVPFSAISEIRMNRLYAQGRQPIQKYKELLTIKNKNDGTRKGWMNMSWDIFPILPKFAAVPEGQFDGQDFTTQVYAIDGYSNKKREDVKLDILVENKYGHQYANIKQALGISENNKQTPIKAQTKEEVNLLFDMGFEKLDEEIEMDTLCLATEQRCGWNEIKKHLIRDLIENAIACTKDYNDPVNHKPMVRYVDIEYLICRAVRRNDYYDVLEAGEIQFLTISDLKMYGLTDEQIMECSKAYSGLYGNPFFGSQPTNYYNSVWNNSQWGDFRVAVLDAEFQSLDKMFFEQRRDGYITELPYNGDVTSKKNKRYVKEYQKLYRAKWVIGTNIVFDYGEQYDVNYNPEGKPVSSFSIYRCAGRSMISQCIAVADDIQLDILKIRDWVTRAKPPGIKVEWGSLTNMTMGENKMSPWEILKIYRDTGDLLYKAPTIDNGAYLQGVAPPVEELKGGLGGAVTEVLQKLTFDINMLREITGINAAADASTPANGALVGTSNLAIEATTKVLKPIISAYQNIKQRTFNNVVTRWQIANEVYKVSDDTLVSKDGLIRAKVSTGVYNLGFQAYCAEIVSEQEKAELQQACLASMQAAKTGSVGITLADYFIVKQFVARGNIRGGWMFLAYKEAERAAIQQLASDQNQSINAQAQQEAANTSSQAMLQAKQMEAQARMAEIDKKGEWDMKIQQMKEIYQMQRQRNDMKIDREQMSTDVKIAKESPAPVSA